MIEEFTSNTEENSMLLFLSWKKKELKFKRERKTKKRKLSF
jgi:hypothetical protein